MHMKNRTCWRKRNTYAAQKNNMNKKKKRTGIRKENDPAYEQPTLNDEKQRPC